jgi:glyoxylase-like metal-dependent hydrolase (beta-lactamase superfamily II)
MMEPSTLSSEWVKLKDPKPERGNITEPVMIQEIITIKLPLYITHVNCYLVKTDLGFVLIDTGMKNARVRLESELMLAKCHPGDLKLIILTHGDFDHIGNAAYLRKGFKTKIAMHAGDVGMLQHGDMFWNRGFNKPLVNKFLSFFIHLGKKDRCTPDIILKDDTSLQKSGLDAQVLNTPGHSSGSICILTAPGDLFCGDLFTNSTGKPMLNSMMYDIEAGKSSLEQLKPLPIQTVYPGHGPAFPMQALLGSPGHH